MSTQSNPVVFISIGQGAFILQHLLPAIEGYAQGIAYIEIQKDFNEQQIKSEIGGIWKKFLQQKQNSADLVRVNFILSTDEAALILPELYLLVEKYLSALYPAGILSDIYCILDDDKLLENEGGRKLVMSMLKTEQAKGLNVYLLSNLTSQNTLIPNESIAHTIAMLTLFKDCVPDSYVTVADASRYNEINFLDNCYSKNGQFLTASSLNVTIPQDGLKAILLTELLTFGKDNPLETGDTLNEYVFSETNIKQAPVASMDYLLGMAIPDSNHNSQFTRRQWISLLFGERLDLLVNTDKNMEADSLPDFSSHNVNIYDLLRYTGEGGIYQNYAATALENAKNDLFITKEKFRLWLDTPPSFAKDSPEAVKRRLSPLVTQNMWPYVIAHEYIVRLATMQYRHDVIEILKNRCEYIVDAHQELMFFLEQVNDAINEYTKKTQILNDTFAPFSPCASDYFRNLFYEFAKNNREQIAELSKGMITALIKDDFKNYLKQLDNYIENFILPSKLFNKPIMDTLYDIIETHGHSNISSALGEWVFNHRRWNIRLKTGYASLHTEINLYMPDQGAADVKRRYEERGFGRMNLFTESNANHVAVLYHAGAFNIEDLFYGSLYLNDLGEK